MPEKYYSVAQAAKKLDLSTKTIHRYIKRNMFEFLVIIPHAERNHYAFTEKTIRAYKQKYGAPPERTKRTYNRRIGKYKRKSEK